jgi:bacterioferritin
MHAKKFKRILGKLSSEAASGLPGEENKLAPDFAQIIQNIVKAKYNQMLQSLRDSWVFQKENITGWQIMDFSMTKMKQLAHLAEPIAENGITPDFKADKIIVSNSIGIALKNELENVCGTKKLHEELASRDETKKHSGLIINLDLSIKQEEYEAEEIKGWI